MSNVIFFLGGGGGLRGGSYTDGMLRSKFHFTGMKYYLTLLTSGKLNHHITVEERT